MIEQIFTAISQRKFHWKGARLNREPQAEALIEATDICVSFDKTAALDHVSMQVHSGEIVTVIGLNGAGKTTLLRVVLGVIKPDKGHIKTKPNLRIGYTPQHVHRDPILPITVRRFLNLGAPANRVQIRWAVAEVEVEKILDYPLANISGGELNRVLLARALLRKPDLLVLDEPLSGVDVSSRAQLYKLIAKLRDRLGCGVLLVSHNLNLVMAATDTVICLNNRICCEGPPDRVVNDPHFTALFGQETSQYLAAFRHTLNCPYTDAETSAQL